MGNLLKLANAMKKGRWPRLKHRTTGERKIHGGVGFILSDIRAYLESCQEDMFSTLAEMVQAESPSNRKRLVDTCGRLVQNWFQRELNLQAEVFPQVDAGDHLRFEYGTGDAQVLILTHIDTVWDESALPYQVVDGRMYGPGAYDMKAGLVQSMYAVKALFNLNVPLHKRIVWLITTDEEVGSFTSRALIESEAKKSDAVFVLEPSVAGSGALKTARKGVGDFTVQVQGRATHAGNEHRSGVSAIQELALQIVKLHALTDYDKGTTVNVGVVRGGTRTNVVAAQALAEVDVRVTSLTEATRITEAILGLQPFTPGAKVTVTGGINRPPMERTAGTVELFDQAQTAASRLGFVLTEESAGGGSDGNFTSALGVPTLDGLGPVGDGAHALNEHVVLEKMIERAALFGELLSITCG